jgi:hypothetical protein
MILALFLRLKQLQCSHHELVRKRKPIAGSDLYLLYTECLECGKESEGIETGGFNNYGGLRMA